MKLKELLQGIEIIETNAPMDMEVSGVAWASNKLKAGEMFVAIPGFETDGHRYIPDAVQRGAAVVLCQWDMPETVPWVRVRSTRESLAALGDNWYGHPSQRLTMIGITGTNGKTSVTYLLKSMLEQCPKVKVGLIGTICNMIGQETLPTERTTPESFELQGLLAKMADQGCTHVVMEVSSHALALHRVEHIRFQIGAFTNLTKDHLDFHKTMEEYRKAKSMLFRRCEKGVFTADDPVTPAMLREAACQCYTVGIGDGAELRAENIELASDHVAMELIEGSEHVALRVGIPGRFTVSNALTALGIARQLGMSMEEAAEKLSHAKGVKGRLEVVPTPGHPFTVLIDYAHTPDGLENVLRSVRDFCRGRLILVFGCGGDRDRTKRPTMGEKAETLADIPIVTSDNPRTEAPMQIIEDILSGMKGKNTIVEENRRKAIEIALRMAEKDDMILLAGKGHETYQILGTEKTHLDEREEVARILWEMEH